MLLQLWHMVEGKLGGAIRILLECLQHVLIGVNMGILRVGFSHTVPVP
jgi:hypothetical protein